MTALHRLRRHARGLSSLVLAGFVLALAISLLASARAADGVDWVCTSTGVKLIQLDTGEETDGDAAAAMQHGECLLCTVSGHPPPPALDLPPRLLALAHVLRPLAAAHIAWITAAPLPARGPPALPI